MDTSSETQRHPTEDGEVQYSIVEPFTDNEGNVYDTAVLLDTDFFDGLSPRNWGKHLRKAVEKRASVNPFILPVKDENGVVQQLQFANPCDRVTKNGHSNHKVIDELSSTSDNISKLAVVHIDEIVEVSQEKTPYYSPSEQHQWLDQNGWLHRKAFVINAKNGTIYELTFDIAKAADGRHILYATYGKIKRVGNVQVNSLKVKGSGQNSNSAYSIPDSSKKSNTQSSEDSSGDDSVQHSLPNEQDIDRLDIYDQRTYTNFGWAVVNNVLSPTEYKSFNQQLGEAVNQGKWYPKTPNGEYMFWVNDRRIQSNKVVFASGSFSNPIISKVIEVDRNVVTNVSDYVEGVIKYGKHGIDFVDVAENYEREKVFSTYRAEDYPSFAEASQGHNQRKNQYSENNDENRGLQQQRGGSGESDRGDAVKYSLPSDTATDTSSETQKHPTEDGGVQYDFDESFGDQLNDWLINNGKAGKHYNGTYFVLGTTPSSLTKHGAPEGEVIMYEECLDKITGLKHTIALDELSKIPSSLNGPILLFNGSKHKSLVALTELQAKNGHDVLVIIHIDKRHKRSVINKIASVYSITDEETGKNKIVGYVISHAKGIWLMLVQKKRQSGLRTEGSNCPSWFKPSLTLTIR